LPEFFPFTFRDEFLKDITEQVFVDSGYFALLNVFSQRLNVL